MLWFTLLACQEPFDVDRHDLVGFRIAAIALEASPDDGMFLRTAVVAEGRPWTETPVDLAWFWVDDPRQVADLDPLSPAAALGPAPQVDLPEQPAALGLVARYGELERRAFVEIDPAGHEPARLTRIAAEALPLTVPGVEPEALLLEARRQLEPGDGSERVEPGGALRLSAELADGASGVVRWMATGGTFFELSATVADWVASDVLLDADEFERDPVAMSPATVTILGLALGDGGGSHFVATDVHVGDPGDGLWVAGRWLPTAGPVDVPTGHAVRGTLVPDDDSPLGLRLTDISTEEAASIPDDGWGTSALDCLVPVSGPFDPAWLLAQWCSRDALANATLALRPTGAR